MLMVLGPHTARGNIPQAIEHSVECQAGVLRFMREHNYTRVETRPEHVAEWTETVIKAAEAAALSARSIPGRPASTATSRAARVRRVLGYNGNGAALPQEDRRNGPQELSGTQFPLVRRG